MLGFCLAASLPIVIVEIKSFVNSQALPPITPSASVHPGDNPERELRCLPAQLAAGHHFWGRGAAEEGAGSKWGSGSLCLPLTSEGCPGRGGSLVPGDPKTKGCRFQGPPSATGHRKTLQQFRGGVHCPGAPGGSEPPSLVGGLHIGGRVWRDLTE